jgi:hypothetical protein
MLEPKMRQSVNQIDAAHKKQKVDWCGAEKALPRGGRV